jgi:integrase/recombinase XerC
MDSLANIVIYENSDYKDKIERIFNNLDISEWTRNDYISRIGVFLDFIKDKWLDNQSFLNFKRYLKDKNYLSVSSKNKYLTVAKIFLNELHKLNYLDNNLSDGIKSFRQDKKHKKNGINEEEMIKLSTYIKNIWINSRIRAIIALLSYQGLRQIEIIRLDIQDIDFLSNRMRILGKWRDDYELIDLHPECILRIKEYIEEYTIKDGPLFFSLSNNMKGSRLTTLSLRRLVKKILNELQINKTVHGFRHFFTTQLIQKFDKDLLTVAEFTRHKSLEMLQIYNDRLKKEKYLPDYYKVFNDINI